MDNHSFLVAIAWPAIVLVGLFLYRGALSAFLSGLGSRITKLSVLKVELEFAASATAASGFVLAELKDTSTPAIIYDSAGALLVHVKESNPADYALIDLGYGMEWISSRLFIAAVLLERMRGVRCFVFVESKEDRASRFVALAHPALVRWALAKKYPWLEAAYAKACVQAFFPNQAPPEPHAIDRTSMAFESERGGLKPDTAAGLARSFLSLLQQPLTSPIPASGDWLQFTQYRERAAWINSIELRALLPKRCFDAHMPEMLDAPRGKRTRAALRRPGEFVALLGDDDEFRQLVDRAVLVEALAKDASEEPDT